MSAVYKADMDGYLLAVATAQRDCGVSREDLVALAMTKFLSRDLNDWAGWDVLFTALVAEGRANRDLRHRTVIATPPSEQELRMLDDLTS